MGVPIDKDGIRTDLLEPLLVRHKPKFIYTLPTFQNPSGDTMSLERRYQLLKLSYKYQVPIVEDDPYSELRYDGAPIPALKALDKHGYVIYLSTFSKVLFSGFRIGWVAAPEQVLNKFAHLKQLTDLHVNTPGQAVMDRFLRYGYYDEHLKGIRKDYSRKRDIMLEALDKYALPDLNWNRPEGGYYIWCRLPGKVVQTKMIVKAAEKGVSYVPGDGCYPNGTQGESYARLNFTFCSPDNIREGIRRLMEAVQDTMKDARYPTNNYEPDINPIV